MRERKILRKCPDGCGRNEYDLGIYRGFHLFQKPFFKGWWIYAEKIHPDGLDTLLIERLACDDKFWDDTARADHPSLEQIEKNILEQINKFWVEKRRLVNLIRENKIGLDETKVKEGKMKKVEVFGNTIKLTDEFGREFSLTKQELEEVNKKVGEVSAREE